MEAKEKNSASVNNSYFLLKKPLTDVQNPIIQLTTSPKNTLILDIRL